MSPCLSISYLLCFFFEFGRVVVLAQDLVGPPSMPSFSATWPPPPHRFAGGRICEEPDRSRVDSPRGRVLISSARFIPCAAPRTGTSVLAALVASGAAFAWLRRLFQRCFTTGSFLAHPSSLHCQLLGLQWTRRYQQRQFSHSPTWSGFMLNLGWDFVSSPAWGLRSYRFFFVVVTGLFITLLLLLVDCRATHGGLLGREVSDRQAKYGFHR